jgi:hypothetical protein
MGVDVDEAGKNEPPRAVDLHIGGTGEVLAEEYDLGVLDGHIDIAPVDMGGSRVIPRNDPGGSAEDCCRGHGLCLLRRMLLGVGGWAKTLCNW